MKNDKTLIPFKSLDSKKDTMKNKDFTDLKETKAPAIFHEKTVISHLKKSRKNHS